MSEQRPLGCHDPVPSWDEYGLALAAVVATRSRCTRRKVGAVLMTPDHRIISTGYNGQPSGDPHGCPRGAYSHAELAAGSGYAETGCTAIHAEVNALLEAPPERRVGATLYITHSPCVLCAPLIRQCKVARVVVAPE